MLRWGSPTRLRSFSISPRQHKDPTFDDPTCRLYARHRSPSVLETAQCRNADFSVRDAHREQGQSDSSRQVLFESKNPRIDRNTVAARSAVSSKPYSTIWTSSHTQRRRSCSTLETDVCESQLAAGGKLLTWIGNVRGKLLANTWWD